MKHQHRFFPNPLLPIYIAINYSWRYSLARDYDRLTTQLVFLAQLHG